MPELPEVEVSRQGIAPFLVGHRVERIIVRKPLRWPVPDAIQFLVGKVICSVTRRGKYLLLGADCGTALLHLGMSGSLHILPCTTPAQKHDHVDIWLDSGKMLRLTDPRRFGSLLWCEGDPLLHPLLAHLGVEPLTLNFSADYLEAALGKRICCIKQALMDSHLLVGVGNIYANEALFAVGIHPLRKANALTRIEIEALVVAIKRILHAAIAQGGTTLRDFSQADGKPGYFVQKLAVYGRAGCPCPQCAAPIEHMHIAQRNSFYCPHCQR